MYAIIETGGKQYRVSKGDRVVVESLGAGAGAKVSLDKVVALIGENGSVYGTPYVKGAEVKAEVVATGLGKKVLVFKHLPRKDHRKLVGHRQPFATLLIKEIKAGG